MGRLSLSLSTPRGQLSQLLQRVLQLLQQSTTFWVYGNSSTSYVASLLVLSTLWMLRARGGRV
uniref:Uncharacterized protein n=1 Tax=Candidatus Aramenus sulfurataquae TaxID=1326980 RepID=A0AAE3FM33_9CREN|nr:hypothetical protein [Candidatus Aramenus sulfurataquae]